MRPCLPFSFHVRVAVLALGIASVATPSPAQILLSGSSLSAESDLTPEQEQNLLKEYWTAARQYKLDPTKTVTALSAWTRDRIGKVQSIQFQPETKPLPDYIKGMAEWNPDTLRMAGMLHTDLALAAFKKRDIPEFEFQIGIADGWFILADNRQSAAGSLRSRWTVSVSRYLLASGEVGIAERLLNKAAARIDNDPAILLAQATVKETQATRLIADMPGGKLDDPASATKPRDSYLTAAQSALEKALKLQPALVEAKVRLAHVFLMKHDDAHAYSLASEVLGSKPTPVMKYLASLIAGSVLEHDRQFDAAARSYVDAVLAVPDGQSGYLALANILQRSGQTAEAGAVLERMFGRAIMNATADPWWIYPLGLDLGMDAQFEEYRSIVRK